MKNIFILLVVLSGISTSLQAQIKKAALISVFGSRNLSDDPMETKMYEIIMKDSSFNLEPIVNQFDEIIRTKFLPEFPFPFISKEEVVNAPGYQDLRRLTRWANDGWYTTSAKGYVPIAAFGIADDMNAIKKSFEVLPAGVEGVMIAYIDFNLYDVAGVGGITSKKVFANVNIKIFDKNGERIFKLRERASSRKGVTAIGGFVMNTEKIMPLIQEASTYLFADMQEKLPKSLKKMAEKMAK